MNKTAEIQHDSKARMKRYREQMVKRGFVSTTIFLSKEHRAELKRLGDEHRLSRAEAAEAIFKVYLQNNPDDKNITQLCNTNIGNQAETSAILEDLKDRVKTLEAFIECPLDFVR